jgi:hypothetical protein
MRHPLEAVTVTLGKEGKAAKTRPLGCEVARREWFERSGKEGFTLSKIDFLKQR